jgi:dolichyl-phosphate mannosyltransferase polypeptide 2 regulatory subunit
MSYSDKVVGAALVSLAVSIFVYYTFWVLILVGGMLLFFFIFTFSLLFKPFIEKSSPIYSFFPSHEYAIAIPATLLVVGLVFIGSFIGYVLINESSKKKKK